MKRRWFQIHLSTLLAAMLLAGMFIHLNLSRRTKFGVTEYAVEYFGPDDPVERENAHNYSHDSVLGDVPYYGWPVQMSEWDPEMRSPLWNVKAGIINFAIMCFSISTGVLLMEYGIRRREARKT